MIMRRILVSLAALAVAVVANADWMHFSDRALHFAIDLPDKPATQTMNTPIQGMNLKTTLFTAQGHGALALVSVSEFPMDFSAKDRKDFQKSYLDSFVSSAHATEISRKPFSVHGYVGTECKFKVNGQNGSTWVFINGHEGFGISVMAPGDVAPIRSRVFNSFKAN